MHANTKRKPKILRKFPTIEIPKKKYKKRLFENKEIVGASPHEKTCK